MAVSTIKAVFSSDIEKVWDIVIDVANYPVWRSDLSKTKILNEKQFIEYTKDGYATTFTITFSERFGRWEFDMDNENMRGQLDRRLFGKGRENRGCIYRRCECKKILFKAVCKIVS